MTIWRTRIACWIPKATNSHSEYVILTAFPLQHWLHERATVLRYTYIACLFNSMISPTKEALFSVTLLNLRTPSASGRLDCVLFIVQVK